MERIGLILITFLSLILMAQQLPKSYFETSKDLTLRLSQTGILPSPQNHAFSLSSTSPLPKAYRIFYTTANRTSKTLTTKQQLQLHLRRPIEVFLSQHLQSEESSHLRDAICRQIERLEPKTSSFMVQSQDTFKNNNHLGINRWHTCYRALSSQ